MDSNTTSETWYQVMGECVKDCKAFDTYSEALTHYKQLQPPACLNEMKGAESKGKLILTK